MYAADKMWPESVYDKWAWLDANHSLERSFKYLEKADDEATPHDNLKSPWRKHPPTFTSNTQMAGRKLQKSGEVIFR